jgi:hypothetical protein
MLYISRHFKSIQNKNEENEFNRRGSNFTDSKQLLTTSLFILTVIMEGGQLQTYANWTHSMYPALYINRLNQEVPGISAIPYLLP